AGAGAVAGLEADVDWALGDVQAEPDAALRAKAAGRLDAPHGAAENGLNHNAGAVLQAPGELVARDERVARERLQVEGGVARQGGQVRPADAAHQRAHIAPAGPRQLGDVDVAEVEEGEVAGRNLGTAAGGAPQEVA